MINLSGEPRLEKLVNAFESKGWKLVGSVDVPSEWWFQDIIQLTSTWRPIGTSVYLTLLTDPAVIDKKIIWSIAISISVPASRNSSYIDQVTLNDIKKTDLSSLIDKINHIVLDNGN